MMIQYATEIKVRAERRCGEMLLVTEKNTGARVNGGTSGRAGGRTTRPPGRADPLRHGPKGKDESSRYQQLAAMPAELFGLRTLAPPPIASPALI
jgi:hypothetical protein